MHVPSWNQFINVIEKSYSLTGLFNIHHVVFVHAVSLHMIIRSICQWSRDLYRRISCITYGSFNRFFENWIWGSKRISVVYERTWLPSHYAGLYKETEHNNCNLKKGSQITFCDNELIVIYLSQRRKKIFNNKHIGIITENNGIITKNKEKCINFNVNVTMKLAGVAKRDGIQVYKKNWVELYC